MRQSLKLHNKLPIFAGKSVQSKLRNGCGKPGIVHTKTGSQLGSIYSQSSHGISAQQRQKHKAVASCFPKIIFGMVTEHSSQKQVMALGDSIH